MMSPATIPGSKLAAEHWQLAGEDGSKLASLVVQLRRRTYAFPYFRLIYAEGDNSQVKIGFASHMVTVTGHGLAALLGGACHSPGGPRHAAHRERSDLRRPQPRANRYDGPGVTDITVEQFK